MQFIAPFKTLYITKNDAMDFMEGRENHTIIPVWICDEEPCESEVKVEAVKAGSLLMQTQFAKCTVERDAVRAECVRWKAIINRAVPHPHFDNIANRAMRKGDLEALEKAIGVKP